MARQKILIVFILGTTFGLAAPYLFKATEKEAEASSVSSEILMKVTAYCPCEKCCGEYADGKTSTNRNAWKTFGIAADPKIIPYGTVLLIPGVGERIVDDTGGAMRQSARKGIYHIDVRFHDHQEAKKFGVQWLKVRVL